VQTCYFRKAPSQQQQRVYHGLSIFSPIAPTLDTKRPIHPAPDTNQCSLMVEIDFIELIDWSRLQKGLHECGHAKNLVQTTMKSTLTTYVSDPEIIII
jgi:hypothetical protein